MLAFHEATQVVDLYGKGKVWLIDKARQERLWQHQQYALFVVLLMKVENVDTLINEVWQKCKCTNGNWILLKSNKADPLNLDLWDFVELLFMTANVIFL